MEQDNHHNPQQASPDKASEDHQPYFEAASEHLETVESTKTRLNKIQTKLKALDRDLMKIDCDHGGVEFTIDGDEITINMTTSTVNRQIRSVLDLYKWDEIDTEYDPETKYLIWSLQTSIDTLTE